MNCLPWQPRASLLLSIFWLPGFAGVYVCWGWQKSEHFPSIFGKVWEHFRQGLREFPKSIFGKVSGILHRGRPSYGRDEPIREGDRGTVSNFINNTFHIWKLGLMTCVLLSCHQGVVKARERTRHTFPENIFASRCRGTLPGNGVCEARKLLFSKIVMSFLKY